MAKAKSNKTRFAFFHIKRKGLVNKWRDSKLGIIPFAERHGFKYKKKR